MKKNITIIMAFILLLTMGACKKIEPPVDEENPEDIIDSEEPIEQTEDELKHERIQAIIDGLTIEEKVGQMFMVGFEGTSVPTSLNTAIECQKFGNFIYFGANVADDTKVATMSEAIQTKVMDEIGIPAFISMDQEGGMVVRFAEEATHFIGNMALAATNNPLNAYQVGIHMGEELRHYGVNLNLAPVLDVNNNPANPVIGIRSYADDPDMVSAYGLQMIQGLKESDVIATVKHFPGHGDTSVDSHYGLPMIPHDMERLINVELAPFIDAIEAGADALMTAHIIFSAIDNELPATLSYKVITELLREELGYDGIVMTDEMRMNAIRNNFTASEAAVKAIQAGVDIVLYAESTSTSIAAYNGVIEAIEDGIISEERINESVWRILDKKIKYGLMEDYLPRRNLTASEIQEHKEWNQALIEASFTQPLGSVDWFDCNASTLLISTKCTRYPLVKGYSINTNQNSLAMVGASLLESEGATQVDSLVIETSLTSTQINQIITQAASYSQVIIAVENATISQATLVNRLAEEDNNILVVALKNPYDYLLYDGINHYVCTFGYFAGSVEALIDLLLGRFEATGTLPVQIEGINSN